MKTFTKPCALRLFTTLLVTFFSIQHNFAQTGWRPMGVNDFAQQGTYNYGSATSIITAPDGTLYMAYHDSNNSQKATVKKFNGSSWELVGTPGMSIPDLVIGNMAIAPNGTLYIAGIEIDNDSNSSDTYVAHVLKYNGSSWVTVGTTNFIAFAIQIAIAPNGTPYIAYNDFIDYSLTVKKFQGNSWSVVGAANFTNEPIEFSFAIAPDGTPYVGYTDFSLWGKPVVKKYNGSTWVTVGTEGFMNEVFYPSLAIAPDGTPYFACRGGYLEDSKAIVKKFNGSSWVTVGVEGFSEYDANGTKITIAPNGTPYIVYIDAESPSNAGITVMKFDGNSWVPVGSPWFSSDNLGYQFPLITITPDGSKAIVAYSSTVDNPQDIYTMGATYTKYFNINCNTPAPTGATEQDMTVDAGQTLNDLFVTGQDVKWYASNADADAGVTLPQSTLLVNNTTYYATQTINGCESVPGLAVMVHDPLTEPLGLDDQQLEITTYPNPVSTLLTVKAMGISNVKVYSLTGQLLIDKAYNADVAEVDMQPLAQGSYMVAVTATGKTANYVVIKGGQ